MTPRDQKALYSSQSFSQLFLLGQPGSGQPLCDSHLRYERKLVH